MATTEEVMKAAENNGVNPIASTTANLQAPAYADQNRINAINAMYDSQINSQRANLESAYNQNMSDLEANRAKIAREYQTQRNAQAVNYEHTRRNFNQQAMMNGLNTGAFSQAGLAQNNAFNQGMAQIGTAEGNANTQLDKSIADLKMQYQSDINDAIAKNDYNRAAALLDEYNQAYSMAMTRAQQLANYGDFSGYSDLYGADTARQMSTTWALQNPLIAYNLGRISAAQYKSMTGTYPPSYSTGGGSGGGGGYYRRGGGGNTKGGGDESGIDLSDVNGAAKEPNATISNTLTTGERIFDSSSLGAGHKKVVGTGTVSVPTKTTTTKPVTQLVDLNARDAAAAAANARGAAATANLTRKAQGTGLSR